MNVHVEEASQVCLTLRRGLVFIPQQEGGETRYTIEDPSRNRFFRIGLPEYRFISMLDGKTTIQQAVAQLSTADQTDAINEAEALIVCDWLVQSELASTAQSNSSGRMVAIANENESRKRVASWNPMCMKIPLARPDKWIAICEPIFSWLLGIPAMLVSALLVVVAVLMVFQQSDRFWASSGSVFAPNQWLTLIGLWLALKVVHEFAHAVVCRRHGGQVGDAGVIMVLLAPLAYVDLTSAWRFQSKWARIHTAIAGMQVEVLIASIAAMIWAIYPQSVMTDVCHQLVFLAGITTIVFNCNPLMRFDGYFVLSDLIEIPNLYSDGSAYLKYLGQRYVMGEPVRTPLKLNPRGIFTRIYGFASFAWRILICVSLMVAAAMMFHRIGTLLAILAAGLWVGLPMVRLARFAVKDEGMRIRRVVRLTATVCLLAIVYVISVTRLTWPGLSTVPAVVVDESVKTIRASSPGFVEEVFVTAGQSVEKNDVIARLRNRGLEAELHDLEYAIKQSQVKARVFRESEEMHSYQAEIAQQESLREKYDKKQEQYEQLILRAPSSGHIVAKGLEHLHGTYLKTGDPMLSVANESDKVVRFVLPSQRQDQFADTIGETTSIRLTGGVVLTGTIERIDPRATDRAPDESLYASNGGPLANRHDERDDQDLFLKPHFTGVVEIDETASENLWVGQRGVVSVPGRSATIANVLNERFHRFVMSWQTNQPLR